MSMPTRGEWRGIVRQAASLMPSDRCTDAEAVAFALLSFEEMIGELAACCLRHSIGPDYTLVSTRLVVEVDRLKANEGKLILPPIEGDPADSILLLKGYRSPDEPEDHAAARAQFAKELKQFIRCSVPWPEPRSVFTELRAWRLIGAELMPHLERMLAAQGDAAEPELIRLQHTLAELLAAAPVNSRELASAPCPS